MTHNFDIVQDRMHSDSSKWSPANRKYDDVLPLWIADMDFAVAPPIAAAVQARAMHSLYGYGYTKASVREAVCERMERRYGWHIEPEWIVFTPGLNPAIAASAIACVPAGGAAVVQTPGFGPLRNSLTNHGRRAIHNPLRLENGRYEMDHADLERKFAAPGVAAMMLCNPHNPVGRVWSLQDLERIGELALKHNALIVSDEIHGEILMSGQRHVPFASLSPELADRSMVLFSPAKTFNLTGLPASSVIIPNAELRKKFEGAGGGLMGGVNIFGLVAMEAAYRHCDDWLAEACAYIEANFRFMKTFLAERVPQLRVVELEGSYLTWLDCRDLRLDPTALEAFFIDRAHVRLNRGDGFGPGGEGFMRLNIACPRSILSEALERIAAAVNGCRSATART